MVILIDAYNLLKFLYGATISERHKDQLIALLNRYVRRKPHTIYVIFDGDSYTEPIYRGPHYISNGNKVDGVKVFYAGYGKSADDVLIEMMKQNWAYDGLLVTNDRALRRQAAPFSIDSLAVKLFYDIISERTHPVSKIPTDTGVQKYTTTKADADLDALLMTDTSPMMLKDETQDSTYVSKDMSKDQKRYFAKLKRL